MSRIAVIIKSDSCWRYKYVRFDDGEVLFCDGASISVAHKNLADERPGKKPVSAGAIGVRNGSWRFEDYGSTTLKLRSLPDDDEFINRALRPSGVKFKREY